MGTNWNIVSLLSMIFFYQYTTCMFGPMSRYQMDVQSLKCFCLFLSLDQSSSEQVVDIVASRNFAAVQTASGKVGWEGGRKGGKEDGRE